MADTSRVSLDELRPIVSKYSEQYGVPEEYIWGVIRAENSGSTKGAAGLKDVSTGAVSSKNARGVMQVTPIALKDVQDAGLVPSSLTHDALSVEDQIGVGTAYLSRLLKLSQKPEEVYAMYNYGPKARFRMDQLPQETQGYLEKTGSTVKSGGGGTGTFGQGMMSSADLIQLLLSGNEQQNQLMSQAGGQMQQAQSTAQKLQQEALQEQQQVITTAAGVAADKAAVNYQQNKTLEQLQTMFGLDVSQSNNEIAKNLAVINSAQTAYEPARAEYDALASKSILDDPLGWIMAQIKLPSVAAKVNAIADAEDNAHTRIQLRTSELGAAKSVVTANTADQLRQIQLKEAENNTALANAQLKEKTAQSFVGIAQSQMQQITLANLIGDNTRSTLTAVSGLEDRAESKEIRDEQRRQLMEGRRLKDEDEARLNARLKIISDAKGMAEPMTVKRLSTLTDKKSQEEWTNAALAGNFGESLDSSLRFYLGNGSSKTNIQNAGGASVWGTAEKLARQGAEYAALADRTHTKQNPAGKKLTAQEAQAQGYDIYKNELIDSASKPTELFDLSATKWDKTYNPYVGQFVGFNKAIDSFPQLSSLKNNALKKQVDTLLGTGAVTTENLTSAQQQQVIKAVISQVQARQLEPRKAAADIAQYMSGIAAYQRELNKYDLFSLPPVKSYFFTVEGDFGAENRRKMDLMNPVALERDIIWQVKQTQEPLGYTPFGFR